MQQARNYLAHEYFNESWTPRHFADVARELSEAKLTFACSVHLGDNIDGLDVDDDARAMLAEIANPLLRETARDYLRTAPAPSAEAAYSQGRADAGNRGR